MRKAFIYYALVVCLVATVYCWGKLIWPAGNSATGTGSRGMGSGWSSNSGGSSWGGGSGGGHK